MLALQRLWKLFYYGSPGLDFQEYFSLFDNSTNDVAHYDLLSLDCFSTETLKIYSGGGALSRFEKCKALLDFAPAQEFLQVCVDDSGGNCGRCFKCVRTMLILDALGGLDKFSKAFDVSSYRENRKWYLRQLYLQNVVLGDRMLDEAYRLLSKDVTLVDRAAVRAIVGGLHVRNALKSLIR